MIACLSPRCEECCLSLRVIEPFAGGVWQQVRCDGCGARMQVRRIREGGHDAWLVRAAAPVAGPLPVVATPVLRDRFFAACRRVARLLRPPAGVEPGMASLPED